MQLYPGDYLADTLHLTTEQHGAYCLLLMTMWRSGASLPNDPAKLARITRVSPKRWPSVWAEIQSFFAVEGDEITNPRLTKEYQKAVSISQERKTAGKKGGEAKALKSNKAPVAIASDLLKHSQKPEPEAASQQTRERETAAASQQDPTDREKLLAAMGVGPDGITGPTGAMIGRQADMVEADKWAAAGLDLDAQCRVIREVCERQRSRQPGWMPRGFGYFSHSMADVAARRGAPLPAASVQPLSDQRAKRKAFLRKVAGADYDQPRRAGGAA
ncbi:YdaU family protein [Falsirhodobacter sp. 1013]|uniref:YdaU family protein n=1 Tax=Falsirhodobacter sp. 1013 TaxID=3417566 RepID=UPI003EC0D58A